MSRILVTGANGFVGRVLCESLTRAGHSVRAAVRENARHALTVSDMKVVGDIDADTDWRDALAGTDTVIHAAARAHILHDAPGNASLYMRTNVDGTRRLIAEAVNAGIGRFIYVSSIKVNGEFTTSVPFTAHDVPQPGDDYGRSKLAAELVVQEVAASGRIDAVIVRPPLVYGCGVRANFLRLMQWIRRGVPLPLAAVRNSRSMVSVWNLADLIAHVASTSPSRARAILVSDGHDLSTPELIQKLADAMGRPARLFSVPKGALRLAARLGGKEGEFMRLYSSLQVDITETRDLLGWRPPQSIDDGIARTVRWFQGEDQTDR